MTKIVFFGTPQIAVPVLVEINKLYQVVAVVTIQIKSKVVDEKYNHQKLKLRLKN